MNNPKTVAEKIDAAANLVEQMMLAHKIKDEAHFKVVHKKAGGFLFDALRQLEDEADVNASVSKGIDLIAKERNEQITKHGRTVDLDVQNNDGRSLTLAAVALIYEGGEPNLGLFPGDWDDAICEKMASKSYKQRLIIAGALIAAEIDRLQAIES